MATAAKAAHIRRLAGGRDANRLVKCGGAKATGAVPATPAPPGTDERSFAAAVGWRGKLESLVRSDIGDEEVAIPVDRDAVRLRKATRKNNRLGGGIIRIGLKSLLRGSVESRP